MNLRKKVVREAKDRSTLTFNDRQYAGIDVLSRRVLNRMHEDEEKQSILCVKDLREFKKTLRK